MTRVVLWSMVTVFFVTLVESTILARLAFLPAVPDLVLLIVVWVSIMNGGTAGATTGFVSGLILDFISAAPIGLNALTKSVTGFIGGRLSGSFNMNRLSLPMFVAAVATAAKALLVFLASLFFGSGIAAYGLADARFWWEIVINSLCAPPVFALLSLFPSLYVAGIGDTQ